MVLTVSIPVAPWLSTTAILTWSWNAFYEKFLRGCDNVYLVNVVEEAELPGHHHQHHRDVHQHQALETQSSDQRLQSVMSWLLLNQSFCIKEL